MGDKEEVTEIHTYSHTPTHFSPKNRERSQGNENEQVKEAVRSVRRIWVRKKHDPQTPH